ncbi:MAG: hypothetical protein IKR81_00675, partial [Victivallales bacterium]|nr:hypothetical protein [Victivallales bacterium]
GFVKVLIIALVKYTRKYKVFHDRRGNKLLFRDKSFWIYPMEGAQNLRRIPKLVLSILPGTL